MGQQKLAIAGFAFCAPYALRADSHAGTEWCRQRVCLLPRGFSRPVERQVMADSSPYGRVTENDRSTTLTARNGQLRLRTGDVQLRLAAQPLVTNARLRRLVVFGMLRSDYTRRPTIKEVFHGTRTHDAGVHQQPGRAAAQPAQPRDRAPGPDGPAVATDRASGRADRGRGLACGSDGRDPHPDRPPRRRRIDRAPPRHPLHAWRWLGAWRQDHA